MPHLSAARLAALLSCWPRALAPAAQAAYTIPSRQPVRRPGRRARRDLRLRDAQPVSLVVRPRQRRHVDRRRRRQRSPGNDFEEITHLTARQEPGANLGWNCVSGNATDEPCTPANYYGPVLHLPERRRRRDRRLRGARHPLPAFAGRYLFGRFNTRHLPARYGGRGEASRTPRRCRHSARTAPGACSSTSLNGPV